LARVLKVNGIRMWLENGQRKCVCVSNGGTKVSVCVWWHLARVLKVNRIRMWLENGQRKCVCVSNGGTKVCVCVRERERERREERGERREEREREREREKQKYLFVVEGCYVQNFRAYVAAHVTIPNPPRQQ